MPNAPTRRILHTRGNGSVVVLADSRLSEFNLLPESIFAAFRHCGIPYRVVDLADGQLTSAVFDGCAAAVIGQEHLGQSLSGDVLTSLLNHVQSGLGLVNLDYNLATYDPAFVSAMGLQVESKSGAFEVEGVRNVCISPTNHYLTRDQEGGARHQLNMPVPLLRVRAAQSAQQVLAESESGAPVLVAGNVGRGRYVQWLASPRIWLLRFFGHAHGLDDLFWKGIAWVARKPFVMLAMPPFVRFRFDDCNGIWREPVDLAFVEVLNSFGHKPNLAICMNALKANGWAKLKALQDSGKVEAAPHTWMPGVSLYHGDESGEYSEAKFGELISGTVDLLEKHGVRPSRILSDHNHECSPRVIRHLPKLGIEYKMNIMLPGEQWSSVHVDWRPEPYGSMSYALDYTPGAHPLFVVFNHYLAFDHARAYIAPRRFVMNRDGGYGMGMWDFLNGLTKPHQGENDLEQMARRLAAHTRLGLNSLFFGGSISHSHFIQSLTPKEWHSLMERFGQLTKTLEKKPVGYDDLAVYARSKFHTRLAEVAVVPGKSEVRVSLSGRSEVPLLLSVFTDDEDAVVRVYKELPAFSGRETVNVTTDLGS
jgi:hypothetical protein